MTTDHSSVLRINSWNTDFTGALVLSIANSYMPAPAGPAAPTDPADIVGSRPTAAKSNIRRHPATTKLG